jgi:SlyX protein
MADQLEELKRQLMEVQSQLAFQDDTVQALDNALTAQQQEILLLRRQLELLKQRQDAQAVRPEPGEVSVADEQRPPHY